MQQIFNEASELQRQFQLIDNNFLEQTISEKI